jgi:RNA polymerase sigma-70 factor, ECF subfamily
MSQPSTTEQKPLQNSPSTLGDVLYAKLKPKVLERDWAALVQSIASGDELALHALAPGL